MVDGQPGVNGVNVTRLVMEVTDPEQDLVMTLNPSVVEQRVLVMIMRLNAATHSHVSKVCGLPLITINNQAFIRLSLFMISLQHVKKY